MVQLSTDIVELADSIRVGENSAVSLVEGCLNRIQSINPQINAFVHIAAQRALETAAQIDQLVANGGDPGPLAGLPFGIKDLHDTCAGMPTRNGSLFDADAPAAQQDSPHIARLRAAGAIPLGKVATAEFGMDGVTHTLAHGTTRNPWKLDRTASGSSGGSAAAVAAGLVPFCTASDGGGSTRCPAGYTGTVGLKPSMGRIPRLNGFSEHSCAGAITTTVGGTARYLDAVSGPDDRDRMTLPKPVDNYEGLIETLNVSGLKAAWSVDLGYAPVASDVARVTEQAAGALVEAAGLQMTDRSVHMPNTYMDTNMRLTESFVASLEQRGILPDNIDKLSPGPKWFVKKFYREFSTEQKLRALANEQMLEQQVASLFGEVDVLITPCHCRDAYAAEGPLPEVIEGKDASQTHAEPFTMLANICWNPSISVPAGLSDDGLPVGLLLTVPRHRDDLVLRLARIWEQTRPWAQIAPAFVG